MLENINPECVNLLDDIRAVRGEELARQIKKIMVLSPQPERSQN